MLETRLIRASSLLRASAASLRDIHILCSPGRLGTSGHRLPITT